MNTSNNRKPVWPIWVLLFNGLILSAAAVIFASALGMNWLTLGSTLNPQMSVDELQSLKSQIRTSCWISAIPGMVLFTGCCVGHVWSRSRATP